MCSWSKTLLAGAALAAALLLATAAHAEEKARLVYTRGSGTGACPEEMELRLSVVARLGYDPFSPQASRVVLARIERRSAQLVGVVELIDREGWSSGRRELYAREGRCDELSRAIALSISLTIDPERKLARRALPMSSGGSVGATPAPPAPIEPAPAPRGAPETRIFSGLMLAGAYGLLPASALGGGAYVGLGCRSLSLQFEARFMQSLRDDLGAGVSLDGNTIDPGLAGCRSFDRIRTCVVGQLGVLRVRSHGEARPRVIAKMHGTLGPRFLLYFRSNTLSVLVGLEGLFNLSFNDARMHNREVWRSPIVSGTLLVGAETDFL